MPLIHRHIERYDRSALKAEIASALDAWGGIDGLFVGRESVLLKPNFVAPEGPDECSTTDPEFYFAVAELLLDAGKRVTIADSPAFGSAALVVRMKGALGECRRLGVKIRTLRKPEKAAGVTGARRFSELTIARELRDYDALVNLPKLKVHSQFVFTGATKNLYGCVTGKRKAWRHFICENNPLLFAQMILANAEAAGMLIHIADGITSMHMKGPRGGQPYPLHALMVSEDSLAIDWLYCARIGLPHDQTPLFRAVEPAKREQLAALCAPIIADPTWQVAPDHQLSPESPIQFSPTHMLRSVYRSATAGS